MKSTSRWTTVAWMTLLAATLPGRAASYLVTNQPGWNLIANQLDGPNGNNIRVVIQNAPIGSQVRKFNLATKAFGSVELLTAAGGWLPGTNILNPGEGIYFSNASPASFIMTFSGNPHVPALPLNIGPNPVLVARQTNAVASISDILGYNPPNRTVLYQFIPGAGHDPNVFASPNYTIYGLAGGAWITPPGQPTNIHVGESVWITTNGSLPVVTSEPKDQTACPGGRVLLTAAASGTAPLSYQWFRNGQPIPNATTPTFTIAAAGAADAGVYFVQVRNPLGTATSSSATVRIGDFEPPVLTCPTNITLLCRGPAGTLASFNVGIADNCDSKPTLVCAPPSGSLFPPGSTTVVCTGSDASGNSNVCSFLVNIVDTRAPVITCPPDLVIVATSAQGARATFTISASDDCDPNPTVDANPPSGSLFPLGTTRVIGVAKDASGNNSACAFDVTVVPEGCCRGKFWRNADVQSPGARFAHAMAYDSARGRVVLFGGSGPNGALGDTWEWDGVSWTFMASSGPSPRAFTALAYDSRIQRTVLFGGLADGSVRMADTWLWDGVSWRPVQTATGPAPRDSHAMAYDSARGRSVLFGGVAANTNELGDTWEFDGTRWFFAGGGTTSDPGPRRGHTMAYGSAQSQMLLFGGAKGNVVLGDTWNWDGTTWKQLAVDGPAPRAFHAMAYSGNCDSAIVFGGLGTNTFSDTWEWDGRAWALTALNNPSARIATAMAHDSSRGVTVLMGGTGGGQRLADTHLYAPPQTAPQVVSTYAACGEQRVVVAFSDPVDPVTAENVSNYALSCGGVLVAITQATVSDDPRIVWLTLAQPLNPVTGGCCTLLINGVRDLCGHVLREYQTAVCCTAEPCPLGSAGAEYWLTFPGNYAPDPTNPPAPRLFIAGQAGVFGHVTIPALSAPFGVPFLIPAGGVAIVQLPPVADLANANDVIRRNGIHVVAAQPVTVYGYNHIRYTTDAYLGLSTRALGQAYLVMAYKNVFNGVQELNGVQFALAAAHDNTAVTIVPSSTVGVHPAGVPFNLTLSRGQTYQLRNTNNSTADLSGTIVVADQPIAVFGSHQCANIPGSNTFFCDYVVEQLPPAQTWGFNFITVPLAGRLFGDTFHIMALLNGTSVAVNGAPIPGLLNQGKVFELQLTAPAHITSDKPVLVAQFSDSSDFDFVDFSDPFMVLVPPTPLYSTSYIVQTPTVDFPTNYLNLMVPAAAVGQINLDGAGLPAALFSPVPTSAFSVAKVKVGTGPHTLFSSNGLPFGVIAYGWGLYDSYGYPGGTCNRPQGQPPRFSCPPTNVVVQPGPNCQGVMPDVSGDVGNGGAAVVILQDPPAGALLAPGAYPLTVTMVDPFGQRQVCHSTVTVPQSSGPGLFCPQNVSTNCASTNGQIVVYTVGLCNTNSRLTCVPPSGSLFHLGVTQVSCVVSNVDGIITDRCSFPVAVNCTVVGVSVATNRLTMTWTGSGVLQKAVSVNGPWITVSNAVSPSTISISGTQGYFRIKQ